MTKVELIASVAAEAGMSKKDAEKAVNAALAAITEELKNGGKVSLVGFGTFEVRERPERQGRNPQTINTPLLSCLVLSTIMKRTTSCGCAKQPIPTPRINEVTNVYHCGEPEMGIAVHP